MSVFPDFYVTEFIGAFVNIRSPGRIITKKRNFYVLSYRVSGETVFHYNNREYTAAAGDVVYIPENVDYTQENSVYEELMAVHFKTNVPLGGDIMVFHFGDSNYVKKLFVDILNSGDGCHSGSLARCMSGLYAVAALIEAAENKQSLPPLLTAAVEYVYKHYTGSDLTVAALAEYLGISGTYLRSLFVENLQCTPYAFITRLRLERAGSMVKSGYYSVMQIAAMCGYDNAKNFSTAFKRYYGCPPIEYKSV